VYTLIEQTYNLYKHLRRHWQKDLNKSDIVKYKESTQEIRDTK